MFSMTVSVGKIRVSWKVRPMPSPNTRCGGAFVILAPSTYTSPASSRSYPVITLNSVVLPEPLGPISPVMLPRSTSTVQPPSACTPPKALHTPSARSSALTARPRRGVPRIVAPPPPVRQPLLGELQDPPRQEQDHQQEQRSEDDLADVRIAVMQRQVLPPGLEDQRPDHRACHPPEAAEEGHQHDRQIEQRVESVLREYLHDEEEPQGPDQAHHHGRDDEGGQLHPHGPHAETTGTVLIIPDSPQLQPEPGPADQPGERGRASRDDQREVIERVVVRLRCPAQEWRVDPDGSAGDRQVERHQLEDEEHFVRDDDEGVPPLPSFDEPELHRDQRGHGGTQRKQEELRGAADLPVLGRYPGRIGTGTEKYRVPQRDVAAVAREDVPGGRRAGEDQRVNGDLGHQLAGEDQREDRRERRCGRDEAPLQGSAGGHCARTARRPNMPFGRNVSTTTRAA